MRQKTQKEGLSFIEVESPRRVFHSVQQFSLSVEVGAGTTSRLLISVSHWEENRWQRKKGPANCFSGPGCPRAAVGRTSTCSFGGVLSLGSFLPSTDSH